MASNIAQAPYNFRLRKNESNDQQKPTISDFFAIQVIVLLREHTTDITAFTGINIRSTLFRTTTRISCKDVLEQPHQNILASCIPLECFSYFTSESLAKLSQEIIPEIQQLFDITSMSEKEEPSNEEKHHQDFPLDLEIFVNMFIYGESDDEESDEEESDGEIVERAVIEESMEEVRMIPASDEAIKGLAKFVLPQNCSICMEEFHGEGVELSPMPCGHVFHHHCIVQGLAKFVLPQNCSICMEEFHGEGVELSPMPCGHVFHHHCIVQWLQTSHVCPLCRHSMPTL